MGIWEAWIFHESRTSWGFVRLFLRKTAMLGQEGADNLAPLQPIKYDRSQPRQHNQHATQTPPGHARRAADNPIIRKPPKRLPATRAGLPTIPPHASHPNACRPRVQGCQQSDHTQATQTPSGHACRAAKNPTTRIGIPPHTRCASRPADLCGNVRKVEKVRKFRKFWPEKIFGENFGVDSGRFDLN